MWSVGWIVATRFVLTPLAPHVALTLTAALFLVAALVPIGLGLGAGDGGGRDPGAGASASDLGLAGPPGRQRQGFQGLALSARLFWMASRRCRVALGQ